MAYLKWKTKTIFDFSDTNINSLYNEGFVFGRTGRGEMSQTRSIRINLSKFKLSSENKRILKKTVSLLLTPYSLPFTQYNWQIGKLAKDFYDTKFGKGTFSANKIKELMTDKEKSNFNVVLVYSLNGVGAQYFVPSSTNSPTHTANDSQTNASTARVQNIEPLPDPTGYCICLETNEILHYCYPFYRLQPSVGVENFQPLPANLGIGMMTKAIIWAKENNKKYIYLGSFQRPTDTYKLQFEGLEWFDGKKWKNNLEELKKLIK